VDNDEVSGGISVSDIVGGPSLLECEVAGLKQRVSVLERDVNNLLAWVKLSEKKKAVKIT